MATEFEIKQQVQEIGNAFAEFKDYNDQALSQKADKEHVDSLLSQAQETANTAISDLTEKLDAKAAELNAVKAAVERGQSGDGKNEGMSPEQKARRMERVVGLEEGTIDPEAMQDYKSALFAQLRKGNAITPEQQKALQVGSDPDGGFWVEPDTDGRVVSKVYEMSPIRQVASIQTIGTDALEGTLDLDEAESGWVGETGARDDTQTPQVGKWTIPVMEMYAQPRITQKMLDDSTFDVEAWLERKVGRRFARMEGMAMVKGDGTLRPRGFLTYPDGTPVAGDWKKIARSKTGADGAFHADNPGDVLVDAVYGLKEEYRANATWAMGRQAEAAVRKLKDGQGNYLWTPDFTQRNGRAILGANVINFEDMPAPATDSLSIAIADWEEAYQIVDRVGTRVLRDPYTAKPFVRFYTTRRVGGDVVNFEAIRLVQFSA